MSQEKNIAILDEICKMARQLPMGPQNAIVNRCNAVKLRMKKGLAPKATPSTIQADEENAEIFASQTKTIYNYLLAGNTLTSLDALRIFGVARLASRICDIERQTGVTANRKRIQVTNRYGKEVWVNEYWIEQEAAQ